MLRSLSIKNLALIKSQEIEFGKGLNIILGETGAGKSLIFDALFFVLSIKTDKSLLRSGEENMRIDAEFSPLSKDVHDFLEEMELDDEELIISRTLHADGRTSTKVNGSPCPQAAMKKLAAMLVDSLMQHESTEILKSKNHLSYLDKFCEFADEKEKLSEKLAELKELKAKVKSLGGSEEERERRKDILLYQIEEIEKADVKSGEDEELDEKIKLLESSEQIAEALGESATLLDGGNGVLRNLAVCERLISKLSHISELEKLAERLESSRIELDDITSEVKDFLANAEADPIELERLNERKDKIKALKRKFGGSIEKVLETLEDFKREYDELCDSADKLEKLNSQISKCEAEIDKICVGIHAKREEGAKAVKLGLEKELVELGMKGVRFEVNFASKTPSADGSDEVNFVFSANKGQELKDLAKTASGGESSRIMLAMKNMFARTDDQKTLVFDEIDSGISGEVGNMMAAKLKSIASRDQVIAITHLPQVASAGDRFIKVRKFLDDGTTLSEAKTISGDEVIREIAHIIGGKDLTAVMLENARELYQRGR